MRIVIVAVLIGALAGPAQAQPVEEPTPAPPLNQPYPPQPYPPQPQPYPPQPQPQPQAYPQPYAVPMGCVPGATDARCLKQILEADPAYSAAKGRRTMGIVLTAVGPSVGVLTMLVAGMVALLKDIGCDRSCDYTSEKVAAGVGGGLVIVGLAVGIPMISSGSREMAAIRMHYLQQAPRAGLSFGRNHALLSTTWSF